MKTELNDADELLVTMFIQSAGEPIGADARRCVAMMIRKVRRDALEVAALESEKQRCGEGEGWAGCAKFIRELKP